MSVRAQIPAIEGVQDAAVIKVLTPMKAILEQTTGRLPNTDPIVTLGANATLAGVINKINEIINRLQS